MYCDGGVGEVLLLGDVDVDDVSWGGGLLGPEMVPGCGGEVYGRSAGMEGE